MAAKDELGRWGEQLVAERLTEQGYAVLDRNWRCEQGEIDLVVQRGDDTVFVEVKTRSGTAFGHPFEAITVAKLARLRRLAGEWCEQHGATRRRIRIDAVAVLAPPGAAPTIEHLEGVF
ncbi:YraN family protein [Planctomonas psychrotolerans]|uniref:YraN family protein n=1 Tax=Planctomonas psychrotolerans TaxID=2528712 RepID=UPI00123AC03A|nr:YraN family protein [Planctomonas psychrotolerans]